MPCLLGNSGSNKGCGIFSRCYTAYWYSQDEASAICIICVILPMLLHFWTYLTRGLLTLVGLSDSDSWVLVFPNTRVLSPLYYIILYGTSQFLVPDVDTTGVSEVYFTVQCFSRYNHIIILYVLFHANLQQKTLQLSTMTRTFPGEAFQEPIYHRDLQLSWDYFFYFYFFSWDY